MRYAIAAIAAVLITTAAHAADVTYTATGTFGAANGSDPLGLAGQPFTITITAAEAKKPSKRGSGYDIYSFVRMSATLGPKTEKCAGQLTLGTYATYDEFLYVCNVTGKNLALTISIPTPPGAIPSVHIRPLPSPVQLGNVGGSSAIGYVSGPSGSRQSTSLGMSGTLTGE